MSDRRHNLKRSSLFETLEARDVPTALGMNFLAREVHASLIGLKTMERPATEAALLRSNSLAQTAHRPVTVFRTASVGGSFQTFTQQALVNRRPLLVRSMTGFPGWPVGFRSPFQTSTTAPVTTHTTTTTATTMSHTSTSHTAAASTTTTDVGDVKNGPLAKAGQTLIALYQQYESYAQSGSTGPFSTNLSSRIRIVGTSVAVDVRGSESAAALSATLSGMGMQVESTDAATHTVEGLLPISKLPQVAQLSVVSSIGPVYRPMLR